MKYPRRWRLFYAVLLSLTRWDVLRFGLLFLAGALGYLAVALIPPWPDDPPPEPAPRRSSWDRRDLPYQAMVGGVLDADRGLDWPEHEVGAPEPELRLGEWPEDAIPSTVKD